MKNFLFRLLLLLPLLTWGAIPAGAREKAVEFTYGVSDLMYWGTKKVETYDIAIRLNDPMLIGKQVTALQVPFPSTAGMADFKAWITTELKLEKNADGKKVNVPNVTEVAGTPVDDVLTVYFPEPYTIPAEGVYVGYSFTLTALEDQGTTPVATTGDVHPDGFYVHTSRTFLNWESRSEGQNRVSAMKVLLSYDLPDYAAAIGSAKTGRAAVGQQGVIPVEIVNTGYYPITSLAYTYDVEGVKGSASLDVSPAIECGVSVSRYVDLPIPALSARGMYTVDVTLTQVNGAENGETDSPSASAAYGVYSFVPRHRPLMEEYTGLWCGYCPRGYAGLEEMTRRYPDDWVAVSYHYDDLMEAIPLNQYAIPVQSFPTAYLDRIKKTDAYCGDGEWATFGIEKTWKAIADEFVNVGVDAVAWWDADDTQRIDIEASVRFVEDLDALDYRLAYILTADDLHDLTGKDYNWVQTNNFYGCTEWSGQPGMDIFVDGKAYVYGLHFNDVALKAPDPYGLVGSIPASVRDGETYRHSYSINTSDVVCTKQEFAGTPLIQNRNNLHVVVLVIDNSTGAVINSVKVPVRESFPDGIATVDADAVTSTTVCYDLQGRRTAAAQKGVTVETTRNADGSISSRKVLR